MFCDTSVEGDGRKAFNRASSLICSLRTIERNDEIHEENSSALSHPMSNSLSGVTMHARNGRTPSSVISPPEESSLGRALNDSSGISKTGSTGKPRYDCVGGTTLGSNPRRTHNFAKKKPFAVKPLNNAFGNSAAEKTKLTRFL